MSQRTLKIFAAVFLVVAFLGFMDASYLAAKHYLGSPVTCKAFGGGCKNVTDSKFATILGVPVALLGSFYYLSVLALSLLYLDKGNKKTLDFLSRYVFVGMAASIYFVFLQAFVIKYWCAYCLGSAATATLLFTAGIVYLCQPKPVEPVPPVETIT